LKLRITIGLKNPELLLSLPSLVFSHLLCVGRIQHVKKPENGGKSVKRKNFVRDRKK
jgi:hypothetical protein